MKRDELSALLKRITLGPQTTLEVAEYDPKQQAVILVLDAERPDSTKQPVYELSSDYFGYRMTWPLTHTIMRRAIPLAELEQWDEKVAMRYLTGLVREFALHEAHEWFRLDGRHVVEPHPERLF